MFPAVPALLVAGAWPAQDPDVAAEIRAYVEQLSPPSVEEVLSDLGEAPSLEEILASRPEGDVPTFEAVVLTPEELARLDPPDAQRLESSLAARQDVFEAAGRGEFEVALRDAWSHLSLADRIVPDHRAILVRACSDLARILREQGETQLATALQLEAWSRCASLHPEHPATIEVLQRLYLVRYDVHDLRAAERFSLEALSRHLCHHEPDGVACTLLASVATCAYKLGEAARAEELFAAVLAWRGEQEERTYAEVVERYNLAVILNNRGAFEEAANAYRGSIALNDELRGADHPGGARLRASLARLLKNLGEFDEAESLARGALESARAAWGADHVETLGVQMRLVSILWARGERVETELLVRDVLARHRERGWDVHPNVAEAETYVAQLEAAKFQFEAAVAAAERSLELVEGLVKPPHPEVSRALHDLGCILVGANRADEAVPHLRRALALREAELGAHNRITAATHAELANALLFAGELEEARSLAQRALSDLGDGRAPAARVGLHLTLARIGTWLGDAETGVRHARAAVAVSEEDPGVPRLFDALQELAFSLELDGQLEEAIEVYRRSASREARRRTRILGHEAERGGYGRKHAIPAHDLAYACLRLGRAQEAFDAAEEGRGRVLLDLLERAQRGAGSGARLAEERARAALKEEEARLSALSKRPDLGEGRDARIAAQRDVIALARRALEQAETAVLVEQGEDWPDARPTGLREVRPLLEEGDLLLSYVWTFPRKTLVKGSVQFMPRGAGVVAVTRDQPPFGVAFPAEHVRRLRHSIEALKSALALPAVDDADAEETTRLVAEVTELLLPPELWERLRGARRLIVLPSGHTVGLPFEVLRRAPDEEPLLALVDEVVQAPSASVYLDRLRATRSGGEARAVLVGGVDFRNFTVAIDAILDAAFRAVLVGGVDFRDHMLPDGASPWRDKARELLDDFGGDLPPLPQSRAEVARIGRAFGAGPLEVVTLTGAGATLGALESKAREARFLHLATHGFPGTDERPYSAALALAPPPRPGPEDFGFLTLDRLLRHWDGRLEGCDLVVLSACDSTREQSIGSGTLCLPWGFFRAGARSVVASLWEVDDEAAALLMTRFYENLLGTHEEPRRSGNVVYETGEGMPKARALVEAKRWLRGAERRDVREVQRAGGEPKADTALRPYSDPYFWAGFVLVGAPD